MKDQQSIIVKEKRELEKWEKKKAKPRISGYIWVLCSGGNIDPYCGRNHYKCKWFYSVKCCG